MLSAFSWTTAILFDNEGLQDLHRPCCEGTGTVAYYDYNYTCAALRTAYHADCCGQRCTVSLPSYPPSLAFLRAQFDQPVAVVEGAAPVDRCAWRRATRSAFLPSVGRAAAASASRSSATRSF